MDAVADCLHHMCRILEALRGVLWEAVMLLGPVLLIVYGIKRILALIAQRPEPCGGACSRCRAGVQQRAGRIGVLYVLYRVLYRRARRGPAVPSGSRRSSSPGTCRTAALPPSGRRT